MSEQPSTLARWRGLPGREEEFVAAWHGLAAVFLALAAPPRWGTLLRSVDQPRLFYSFGPWPSLETIAAMRADPRTPDAYEGPLPLVVEIWSPTTGDYDFEVKLRGNKERGDEEIWYVHPYERTLTIWIRQPDRTYAETIRTGGIVEPAFLPGVATDLDELVAG